MAAEACKICSADTESVTDNRSARIDYFCRKCGFIFIDAGCIVSPAEEKARYSTHNNTMENQGYVDMFRDFIGQAVRPYRKRLNTALDFGCGPGPVLAELLQEEGLAVDRYDPYFFPEKVYQGRKYDLVTGTEVFEHLREPLAAMELIAGCLNPGGILAVMTYFHPAEVAAFRNWWYRRDCVHISFYTPETFKVLAGQTGFRMLFNDGKKICVLERNG
jgi:SAM-dependent methyltransferase